MSHAIRLSLLIVALTVSSFALAGGREQKHGSLVGRWQIDPSGSQYKGRAPLQGGTMRFEPTPNGIRVVCDVMTASGVPFHFEYQGPEDGSKHPVTGNPYYDSESTAWSDSQTATRTEIRSGKVIGTSTLTLAADGQSFTAVSRRSAPEDGHLYTSTIVWKRVAGS